MPYSFTMSPKIYQRSLLLVTVINNGTGMFTTCAFVQPGSWLAPGLVGASYCCWLGFPGVWFYCYGAWWNPGRHCWARQYANLG